MTTKGGPKGTRINGAKYAENIGPKAEGILFPSEGIFEIVIKNYINNV